MKTVKKNIMLFVCTVAMLLLIMGCGQTKKDNVTEKGEAAKTSKVSIRIIGGGTGGAGYTIGSGMVNLFQKYAPTTNPSIQTGGADENCVHISKGRGEVAITNAASAYQAYHGEGAFKEKSQNIRGFLGASVMHFHFIVPENSVIKSIKDLKGKNKTVIAVGAPGTATEKMDNVMLEAYGLVRGVDYKPEFLAYNEAIEGMRDGKIDMGIFAAEVPIVAVSELCSTHKVRFLSIDEEHQKLIIEKMPYLVKTTTKSKTYPNLNEDVPTLGVATLWIVKAELDEKIVYNLTASVMEHIDELQLVHASAKGFTPEAVTKSTIPFHPGSIKYFEEKGWKYDKK